MHLTPVSSEIRHAWSISSAASPRSIRGEPKPFVQQELRKSHQFRANPNYTAVGLTRRKTFHSGDKDQ